MFRDRRQLGTTPPHPALAVALAVAAAAACGPDEPVLRDLPELAGSGELRVLIPRTGEADVLPRQGHPIELERELAEEFAESAGLEVAWVRVDDRNDLIPRLLAGDGDLVAANLTVTPDRERRVAFSEPIGYVREQVVTRAADVEVRGPEDLVGRRVAARRSSSFWGSLERLRADHPGIQLVAAPEDMDTEEILYRVATGAYDVTVADDNLVSEVLAYMPELRLAFDLTEDRPVAWALRPNAPALRAAVDSFIAEERPAARRPERYVDDLPGLRERNVIRVLTRNSASTYYVWRGGLVGFEYDLAQRFAERLGLHLEIVVAPTRAALLTWLREGRGDLVAASLTPTAEREARGIEFSRPYNWVRQMVVTRASDSTLTEPEDLDGRTVVVRRSSSYWPTLADLRDHGAGIELVAAPEGLETEGIIARVADGTYDLTVADSHILDIELTWRDDIRGAFPLTDSIPHAWAVRSGVPELRAAIDAYFDAIYRGVFYNITRRRYFRNRGRIERHAVERSARSGTLSPWDELVKRYAGRYELDWRLIVAQMYQESRFDPAARSFAGAVGLMQVMPGTARELGIDSVHLPGPGIHAGVRYLRRLHDRIDDAASRRDRLWFALAAYNAGYGHLFDARRLAERLGRDPAVWFGSVADVMPLLARRDHHSRARYGYCRCTEPVRYVRAIRDRYRAYSVALPDERPGSP